MKIQSVLFPKAKYTTKQAESWLKKHNFRTTFHGKKVDETDKYYRYRQAVPNPKNKYFVKHAKDGILFVIMFSV
jgi:hypothetical protein